MTQDPPGRVAAMLSLLRELADEIVVAVDSRVDPATLGPLVLVADRVVRFRFRPPVDRPRAWLAAQCRGDWILSIDGDEVPGAALLAQLPAMLADPDVLQHHLPRRWLFPDPDSWLAELPWWPDHQVRLVRNGPALAARSGVHGGMVAVLPNRQAEAPLYHLDCVLTSEDERRAKAERYEAERPDHRAFGGGSLNHTLYLPERTHGRAPEPVPDDDRALIAHVLAGAAVAAAAAVGAPDPEAVPLVPDEDIDALAPPVPGTPLPDGAYAAGLALADHEDRRCAPGERRPVYVRITNAGGARWPWGLDQEPQIRVAHHWRRSDGEMLRFEGLRSPLPVTLGPGETTVVPVWVDAPADEGTYLLDVDLVHEHVRWFDSSLTVEIQVADRIPRHPAPSSATGATSDAGVATAAAPGAATSDPGAASGTAAPAPSAEADTSREVGAVTAGCEPGRAARSGPGRPAPASGRRGTSC